MAVDRSKWPMMVQIGLWGLSNRASAWVFVWLSLAIAAGCVAYGFINHLWFIGSMMVIAALWYFLSIRWVDHNSSWS
jgi:hypothetical protein